jgi:hypothetical protein
MSTYDAPGKYWFAVETGMLGDHHIFMRGLLDTAAWMFCHAVMNSAGVPE